VRGQCERAVSLYDAVTQSEVKTCKAVISGSNFSMHIVLRGLVRCATLCETSTEPQLRVPLTWVTNSQASRLVLSC
jgi:hypothetical protein